MRCWKATTGRTTDDKDTPIIRGRFRPENAPALKATFPDFLKERDRGGVKAFLLKHLPMERGTCVDCRESKIFHTAF